MNKSTSKMAALALGALMVSGMDINLPAANSHDKPQREKPKSCNRFRSQLDPNKKRFLKRRAKNKAAKQARKHNR